MNPGIGNTAVDLLIDILAEKEVASISGEEGNGRSETEILDSVKLSRLATRHRVTYQVLQYARQHEGLFPEKQMQQLEEHAKQNAVRSLMQLHELIRIAGMFNDKGISWACIKGPQLSRMLYGREALKESVDLDLMLLDRSVLDVVHKGLKEMGYGHSNLDDYRTKSGQRLFLLAKREIHYYNAEKDVHLDLHVRTAANAYLTIFRHKSLFMELTSYDLEGTQVPILQPEAYLNFLCHHGAVHQFSSLGWLMDVRHFIRQMKEEMDFARVQRIAGVLKTGRSLWLSLVLLQELFGDELPVPIPKPERQGSSGSPGRVGRRIRYLVSSCRQRWGMDAAASLSIRRRTERFRYLMSLSEGLAAKFDIMMGILLRNLSVFLRKLGL